MTDAAESNPSDLHPWVAAAKVFTTAYRVELVLFCVSFFVLAMFSSQRFLRQSEAPHFVYQSKALLDGRLDIDPQVLPNLEDWACVRRAPDGSPVRCTRPLLPTDKWFSSFPAFPAVVMAPFVWLHGYQFNDTSFGVLIAALAVALFYSLLRLISEQEVDGRPAGENQALSLLLAFGTLFFYCSIRGEVWFSAEVMGVAFTCLYARNSVRARRPVLAGVFFSMAVLTRTPLAFTGIFFVLEALAPTPGKRKEELGLAFSDWKRLKPLGQFALGAAPLALLGMIFNVLRFGSPGEFGHRFFFENRVNADIDTFGLFHPHYLARNLDAAFLHLPVTQNERLAYDPWGMSLILTLPLLLFAFVSPRVKSAAQLAVGAGAVVLLGSWLFPATEGLGGRPALAWVALAAAAGMLGYGVVGDPSPARLRNPLLLTLAATALPGLLYQNTGYAQFGFRFSLDYTPYLLLLFAVSGWRLKQLPVVGAAVLGVLVNFWGAVGFRGYTEMMRNW